MLTAGRISERYSVASINSAIIVNICHDARAFLAVARSCSASERRLGISFLLLFIMPAERNLKGKTLVLVDGSSYLYRAYHAMPDLRGPDGEPTGALYGIVNMLRRMRKEVTAEYSACVFDAKGKTVR